MSVRIKRRKRIKGVRNVSINIYQVEYTHTIEKTHNSKVFGSE
jgi:hypothetical protein